MAAGHANEDLENGVAVILLGIILAVGIAAVVFVTGLGGIWIANTLFDAGWPYRWDRVAAMGVLIVFVQRLFRRRSK